MHLRFLLRRGLSLRVHIITYPRNGSDCKSSLGLYHFHTSQHGFEDVQQPYSRTEPPQRSRQSHNPSTKQMMCERNALEDKGGTWRREHCQLARDSDRTRQRRLLTTLLLVSTELEVLAALEGHLHLVLADGALKTENDLLGGLGLLVEDGLGLSTVSWKARRSASATTNNLIARARRQSTAASPRDHHRSCHARPARTHQTAFGRNGAFPGRRGRPFQSCTG